MPFRWPYSWIYCSIDQQNCRNIYCLTPQTHKFLCGIIRYLSVRNSDIYLAECMLWFVLYDLSCLIKDNSAGIIQGVNCIVQENIYCVLFSRDEVKHRKESLAKNEWIM